MVIANPFFHHHLLCESWDLNYCVVANALLLCDYPDKSAYIQDRVNFSDGCAPVSD